MATDSFWYCFRVVIVQPTSMVLTLLLSFLMNDETQQWLLTCLNNLPDHWIMHMHEKY